MKRYEMIREIFNECSGNQMRDVFFSEVSADDTDELVKTFCTGTVVELSRTDKTDGSVIYDIVTDGMRQRISLTEC